ncbi:MAG: fumarylacetoacetate hydrolase family protein [Alphaproteobacteria bacterium]|nr:fumarylacetoacetate hydrolase family protein [Alphaproteobacteria bacterium]
MKGRRALAALLGLCGLGLAYDLYAQRSLPVVTPNPLSLPAPDAAVALARLPEGTLLLTAVDEESVSGALLEGSPLEAYAAHGLAGLRSLRDAGPIVQRPLSALLAPVDTPAPHIAVGNNFAQHQEEVGLHDAPELFPKMADPSAWNAEVPHQGRMDFEVELCAVALAPLTPGDSGPLGFVLCNDFTDRWTMLRELDPRAPLGTTGFPDGKGAPGFLPTGPWLVIPDDPGAFAASVQLRLSVDGRLRQDSPQTLAIWDHPRILQGAFERCGWDFRFQDAPVDWPACEQLPAGTLILGGTPSGVAFRPWNIWAWWKYLAPGALVVTEGTGLGRMQNRIAG